MLDPGTEGRNARTGVKLDVEQPAWLVLGQSYSDAWRARCDGRDLGAPVPVDGYAMGWRVPAGCRDAEMAFAPDRIVRAGYLLSLPCLLAMLALLLLRRPRRRRPARGGPARARRAARSRSPAPRCWRCSPGRSSGSRSPPAPRR